MGGHKGEAGASPALSRNCNPPIGGKPGRLPVSLHPHAARQGGGCLLNQDTPPLLTKQGFLFNDDKTLKVFLKPLGFWIQGFLNGLQI
jgi:hypothetical protein